MFYFLKGLPTSRAASLIVTEDKVMRDRFYDGHPTPEKTAVVLRLARSWFRIGSLEIIQKNEEFILLRKVVDFMITEHFTNIDPSDAARYVGFFYEIVAGTATMIAKWQSVGFAHGVCNTDNFSLLSITIDYGPFGFLDAYDPGFVPNTSDDTHRYSYEKQPDVGHFNLKKLLSALRPLLAEKQKTQAEKILEKYADIYKSQFMSIFVQKLGFNQVKEDDELIVAILLKMMSDSKSDFTVTFRNIGDWSIDLIKSAKVDKSHWALNSLASHSYFRKWCKLYHERIKGMDDSIRRQKMHRMNPKYILRNWMSEAAITAAERGDFSKIEQMHAILREPFVEQSAAEAAGYAAPPPAWAAQIRVSCSS